MPLPENLTPNVDSTVSRETHDLQYTFVVKDARKFINLIDVIPVTVGDNVILPHLPNLEDTLTKRIVFAFICGRFNTYEVNNYLTALANSAGTAPDASLFFIHYHEGLTVESGGLSFGQSEAPVHIREVQETFSEITALDAENFHNLKTIWFGILRAAEAVRLPHLQ